MIGSGMVDNGTVGSGANGSGANGSGAAGSGAVEAADEFGPADDVSAADENAVAIVGMAGRFPGAGDVDALWHNLLSPISGPHRVPGGGPGGPPPSPDRVPMVGPVAGTAAGVVDGLVDGIELFDADAFGFTGREAETTQPQHRLLLECAWEALERAGYNPAGLDQPVGVFAGCAFDGYLPCDIGPHGPHNPDRAHGTHGAGAGIAAGIEPDSATALISYKLGLRGPSLTVQTHSSTSLVAVHLACQSLLTFECDMALAGGASFPLPQPAGYHSEADGYHSEADGYHREAGGAHSPDGRVRGLDATTSGTGSGTASGTVVAAAAVVVLKRLADALADGDLVHAVIRGSAVNNDGRDRAAYDVPAVSGQAAVIETALAVADVGPASIGYIECHGAGASRGDSVELAALRRVFGRRDGGDRCVLSSVKPSIGDLDRAAGVTALIRATLSLRHQMLPATAGFERPSPALAPETFAVLTQNQPWPAGPAPRRAGVSSFGLGGTNAHVVLEEAAPRHPRPAPVGPYLLAFSAASLTALNEITRRLRERLAGHPELDLADVAFTLQVSRGHFALRRAVVCRDRNDALSALADPRRWIDGETTRRDPRVTLVPATGTTPSWLSALASAARRLIGDDLPSGGDLPSDGRPSGDVRSGDLSFDDLPSDEQPSDNNGEAERVLAAVASRLGARISDAGPADALEVPILSSAASGPGQEAAACGVLETVARLWQVGCPIDWSRLSPGHRYRVELPAYPFQRRRHWIGGPPDEQRSPAGQPSAGGAAGGPAGWTRLAVPAAGLDRRLRAAGPWLLLAADSRGEALGKRLVLAGAEVVTARPGAAFRAEPDGDFAVRPGEVDDLAALLRSLLAAPRTIVHAFSLGAEVSPGGSGFARARDWGVDSAIALTRALARAEDLPPAEIVLLTSGAAALSETDLDHPEHAALASLLPWLAGQDRCQSSRHIDLEAPVDEDLALGAAVAGPSGRQLAIRDGQPWILTTPRCRE